MAYDSALQEVCAWALERGATSLHLQPGAGSLLYVQDRLENQGAPLVPAELVTELTGMAGRRLFVEDLGDFRVQVLQLPTGPVVTLRPILQAPSWAELGLPQTVLDCLLERPGVVVVSGAPARRPVETWAALLDAFNISLHGHIIVLERAREYFHFHKNSMVSQREWGEDFTDWRSAIAQATRTGCEVLALGDLSGARSLPAALAATHSARWVVGLLHEPNCEAVLARLIGGSPARRRLHVRELLASYLAGIVNLTQGSLELLLPDPDLRQELAAGAWHELRATHRWALPS